MMATEQKNDFDDEAFDMVKKDFQKSIHVSTVE